MTTDKHAQTGMLALVVQKTPEGKKQFTVEGEGYEHVVFDKIPYVIIYPNFRKPETLLEANARAYGESFAFYASRGPALLEWYEAMKRAH